ncbi:MAG: polysaccharide deacetylase family protein [Candidatus Omnitrophica bacterium]|nr:polysaccharide deacetylase family protein [Candidatus Omnitrophota bacterium]
MTNKITQPIVLMYHSILAPNAPAPGEREAGAELYDVSAEKFRAQLSWLKEHQYRSVTVHKNLDVFSRREILITFDDGEKNNYTAALPLLQEFGFTGHFFLIAKRVGKEGYMGWDEIRRLLAAGMVVGSHGFSHEILTNLLNTQIEEELSASRKYLERNLGIPVESLSIPRGFCNDKILRMAKETGYKYIFLSEKPAAPPAGHTSQPGRSRVAGQAGCFSRVAVKSNWTIDRFAQAMSGNAPLKEKILVSCKNSVKKILGGGAYDWARRMMLKIK